MELLSPPESTFESPDEAQNYAQAWAKEQGYAITTKKSKYRETVDERTLQTRYLKCVKGGVYRSNSDDEQRQKERVSRLTDCPFAASIRRRNKDNTYLLLIENPWHNHDAIPPIAFHQHCKLTDGGHQLIDHLTQAKSQPREMLTSLRLANPDQLIVAQDIYNEQKRLRQDNLAGGTPIEVMHQFLQDSDWFIGYNTRISGELTHLFFAHPKSIKLFKRYPEVLMMDCTYKVTRFKMLLLVIVGTTAVNQTFFVGFVFLSGEAEEDYFELDICVFPGLNSYKRITKLVHKV